MWTEGTCLHRALLHGRLLLHDFINHELFAQQALPDVCSDCRTTKLRITHHDDGKTLAFLGIGIDRDDRVFDRNKRREELANLLDLGSRLEIAHVDFEHSHRNVFRSFPAKRRPPPEAVMPARDAVGSHSESAHRHCLKNDHDCQAVQGLFRKNSWASEVTPRPTTSRPSTGGSQMITIDHHRSPSITIDHCASGVHQ